MKIHPSTHYAVINGEYCKLSANGYPIYKGRERKTISSNNAGALTIKVPGMPDRKANRLLVEFFEHSKDNNGTSAIVHIPEEKPSETPSYDAFKKAADALLKACVLTKMTPEDAAKFVVEMVNTSIK